MKVEEVVEAQFRVLALADKLELDRDSVGFKDFKNRIFENIKYLSKFRENS